MTRALLEHMTPGNVLDGFPASEHYSRAMIEGLLLVERGRKRVRFRIPSELRERWGMAGICEV